MNTTISNVSFGAKVITQIPKNFKETAKPDFFRDSELFDPAKDYIDRRYSKYDTDDLPIGYNIISCHKTATGGQFPERMPYKDVVELYLSDEAREIDSVPGLFEKIM